MTSPAIEERLNSIEARLSKIENRIHSPELPPAPVSQPVPPIQPVHADLPSFKEINEIKPGVTFRHKGAGYFRHIGASRRG